MKFLKVILIIVLVLLVVLAGAGYLFLKNFDLNRYREQIAQGLSDTLKRDVQLGDLQFEVSWSEGVSLLVRSLQIAAQAPGEQVLDLQEARMHLDLTALWEGRELVLTKIVLQSPVIRIQRTESGELDLPVPPSGKETSPSGAALPVPTEGAPPADVPVDVQEFQIKLLEIRDGRLLVSGFPEPGSPPLMVQNIDLTMKDFRFDAQVPFDFSAALGTQQPNITLSGALRIDIKNQEVRFADLSLQTDLNAVPEWASAWLSDLKDITFPPEFRGTFKADVPKLSLGPSGVEFSSVQGQLQAENIAFKPLPTDIAKLTVPFEADARDLRMSGVDMQLGSGQVQMDVDVQGYLQDRRFKIRVKSSGLDLAEVLPLLHPDIKLSGLLLPELEIQSQGLTPEQILSGLSGAGNFSVQDGHLHHINLLKAILREITLIPGLVDTLTAVVPEPYRQILTAKETVFQQISANIRIQPEGLDLQELSLSAPQLDVQASGLLTWDQELSLETKTWIPADLAEAMIGSVDELKALQDESGRLHIPLRGYSGPVQEFKTFPDLEDLGKKIVAQKWEEEVVQRGEKEIKTLLDGILDREEVPVADPGPAEPATQEGGEPQAEEPSVEEQLIQGIFDAVFE